jgi:hypothetical protein
MWRARRAKLPWHELEAEAARQGCSPADICFDRAGVGGPGDLGPAGRSPERAGAGERERQERAHPVP